MLARFVIEKLMLFIGIILLPVCFNCGVLLMTVGVKQPQGFPVCYVIHPHKREQGRGKGVKDRYRRQAFLLWKSHLPFSTVLNFTIIGKLRRGTLIIQITLNVFSWFASLLLSLSLSLPFYLPLVSFFLLSFPFLSLLKHYQLKALKSVFQQIVKRAYMDGLKLTQYLTLSCQVSCQTL